MLINESMIPTLLIVLSFSLKIKNPKVNEIATIARLLMPKTIELSSPLWCNAFMKKYNDPKFAAPKTMPVRIVLELKLTLTLGVKIGKSNDAKNDVANNTVEKNVTSFDGT